MSLLAAPLLFLASAALVARTTSDPARGAAQGAGLVLAGWVAGLVAVVLDPGGAAFDALILTLVVGTGGIVLAHAARALRHEPYQRRFAVVGPLLLGAVAVATLADPLEVVLAGWLLTSLLTVALVRTGPAAADPDRAVRLGRAFLVGDAALAGAVVLTVTGRGPAALAAVLLVTAAATRGAAGPFLRWLPDTLSAPTPSSAVLHAGVVASGVLVLLRHGDTVAGAPGAALALALSAVVVGGLTCIVAEAVMTTRPDVKGQLAWSTVAQLGFTLVLVGLGFHVAAGLHVVAHGMYKGASFLSAGSAVRLLERRRSAPVARPPRRSAQVAVTAVAALATAAVPAVAGSAWTVELALTLGLGVLAVWCATGAATGRLAHRRQLIGTGAAAVGAAVAYAAVTVVLKAQVQPELAVADPALPPAAVLPVLAGLALVAATRGRALPSLWARATALGSPTPPATRTLVPTGRSRPVLVPVAAPHAARTSGA